MPPLALVLCLLLSAAGVARPARSAEPGPWTSFTPAEGLASNYILATYQDAAGFLWVGTAAGLSVTSPQGDWLTLSSADGLAGNRVLDIVPDPADSRRIWLATDAGVTMADHAGEPLRPAGYSFTRFNADDGLPAGYASSLVFDHAGRLWVGTSRLNADGREDGFGVSVIDMAGTPAAKADDQVRTYIADAGGPSGNAIRDMTVDPQGVLWVATNYGLSAFSADTWTSYLTSNGMPSNDITSVLARGAWLWVGTSAGILLLDPKGTPHAPADDRRAVFKRPLNRPPAEFIRSIVFDGAGRLWIGGSAVSNGYEIGLGLVTLELGPDPFDQSDDKWGVMTIANGLASDTIQSLTLAAPDRLWVGTAWGLNRLRFGPSPFNLGDDAWETFTSGNRLAGASVQAIAEGGPDGVWLGTERGLSYLAHNASLANHRDDRWVTYTYGADYLADDYILALATDARGRVWVGTYYGLSVIDTNGTPGEKYDDLIVTYISGVTGLAHNQINDIAIDSAGRAWIASGDYLSGALQVLDVGYFLDDDADDTWATFSMASSSLPDPYVRAVALGAPGVAWVGTQAGVARLSYGPQPFDQGDDTWAIFTASNSGLAFDSIRDILVDRAGNVWFALTLEGVSVYSAAGVWQSFTSADGLASNVVRGLLIDRSGLIWMGTASGGVSLLNDRGTPTDKSDDRWYRFTTADGLGKNQIQALRADRWGQIWIGTAGGGVSVYSRNQLTRVYLPLAERS